MAQLDLLSFNPPCKVIVFPMERRIGKIRHTAEILSRKSGHAADAYWRQVCQGFLSHLERMGVAEQERKAQLRAFFDAVQHELMRMSYQAARPGERA